MARALFKSWFVDFDPVRAKAEGRGPGVPKPIADLFPARLVDSELGEIPEGWSEKPLDEMARFVNGLALQKYPPSDGKSLPVIKIAQLRSRNTGDADRASSDLAPDYIVQDGDILFSWSGSLECVLWAGGSGALNQHLFKVFPTGHPAGFVTSEFTCIWKTSDISLREKRRRWGTYSDIISRMRGCQFHHAR